MAELARHVTERDREIALRLYEQQLLATDQLTLLFSSKRRALDRLLLLYHQRVLDRFYPPWRFGAGKPQAHWLLDEGGAQLVAAMLGVERKRLGWQRRDDWGSHRQLAPVAPRGGAVHRWRSTASSPISSPSRSPTRR